MAEKIRSGLYRLKERVYELVGREPLKKETVEWNTDSKSSHIPKTSEKRREEAMGYLVKKYYESKMREEEFRKKLESYGRVRRWVYERSRNLQDAGMIVKETVGRPLFWASVALSGWVYMTIVPQITPKIMKFVDSVVPPPYNGPINVVLCFPVGFSFLVVPPAIYAYKVKRELKKRLREDYGIEI